VKYTKGIVLGLRWMESISQDKALVTDGIFFSAAAGTAIDTVVSIKTTSLGQRN